MMPDLGKYEATVLSAYGASLVLLAAIILLTWVQARRTKRRLQETEARAKGTPTDGN